MKYRMKSDDMEYVYMNKTEVVSNLIANAPNNLTLVKASLKSGGGLLKVNEDNSFSKIMLRRSKSYLEENVGTEQAILYDVLSWFRINKTVLKNFEYILFALTDQQTNQLYPLIFSMTDIQQLINNCNALNDDINIYIQKKRGKEEFVITRFGVELNSEIDVTSHHNAWNILD